VYRKEGRRNEGRQGGYNSPGDELLWGRPITAESAEMSQQYHKYFPQYSTFASERPQLRTLGGARLASYPGPHLASFHPWSEVWCANCKKKIEAYSVDCYGFTSLLLKVYGHACDDSMSLVATATPAGTRAKSRSFPFTGILLRPRHFHKLFSTYYSRQSWQVVRSITAVAKSERWKLNW